MTRLVAIQENVDIKGIAVKFENKIRERVKGCYKDVLLGVLGDDRK